MSEKILLELLEMGPGGVLSMQDREFSSETFSDFRLPGPSGSAVLERVRFHNCRVYPVAVQIDGGATLRQVLFEDFSCGDAMYVSSDVLLDRVVIRGRAKPKMICVSAPARAYELPDCRDVEWCLDIREYDGEVSIAGPPGDKILRAPGRQVLFDNAKLVDVDWETLGIHALSYWKILARKSRGSGAAAAVYSTPLASGRNYERSMRELEILRSEGILS